MSFGKPYIMEIEGCIHDWRLVLRPDNSIDKDFMYHLLWSGFMYAKFEQTAAGTGVKNLNIQKVKEIPLPLPPLPTQHKIVAALDEASAQITASKSAIQSQLDALDQLWQSSLSEVFENEEYELVKLWDVFTESKKAEIKDINDEDNCSFVPMADMNQEVMYFETKQIKTIWEVRKWYTYFAENDVLLAKVTPCFENGKSWVAKNLINGIWFWSSEYYVLRANERILPEILYYLISSKKFRIEWAKNMWWAVWLQRVKKERINNFEFYLPDLATQTRIVAHLDDLSQSIQGLRSLYRWQMMRFDALRASVLDQAFRGELVVE